MSTQAPLRRSFRESFREGWRLLGGRERALGAWLTAGLTLQGLLDAVAVTAVFPFVGVVVEPDLLQTSRPIRSLHALLGAPAYMQFVEVLAAGVLAILALNAVLGWALQYALDLYASRCQTRLARELLSEAVQAPYAWLLTKNAATLSRLLYDDVARWSRGFVQRVMTIVNAAITTAIGAALLLLVAPWTGILALALLGGVALAVMSVVKPRFERLSQEKRAALDRTLVSANQAFSGIKDVKLSSREAFFVRLFSEAYTTTSRTHARLNAWQQILPISLPVLGQATLIAVAVVLLHRGSPRGEVAAQMALLVLVSSRIVPAVSQLSSSISLLWNAFPFVQGIHELRESVAAATREAGSAAGGEAWDGEWRSLQLTNVSYRYPASAALALQNVTVELRSGLAYGVAGPSGAGKSTLVDLVLALLDPVEGELMLDGRPLRRIDRKAWQARIGYVPQTPYIADDTLRANVAFGVRRKQIDDAWVRECLLRAHLGGLLSELPQGLDTSMGDRGARVSGGQRQRIAIARALYNRPRILVLDEATSALDRISEGAVQEAIEALHGSLTTLTIAHRLPTIRACDAIFLLDGGRLVGEGGYEELLARSPLFRAMAAEQPTPAPAPAIHS